EEEPLLARLARTRIPAQVDLHSPRLPAALGFYDATPHVPTPTHSSALLSRKHIMLCRKHSVKRQLGVCLPPCILGVWLAARILMPCASVGRVPRPGPQN